MEKGRTICFTGHRDLSPRESAVLAQLLHAELEKQIANGAVRFRAGGARGFDTLAAKELLKLKCEHPRVKLELILPCPDQTKGWNTQDVREYREVLAQADGVHYMSTGYYAGVYQLRDRALVEGSDLCVAYLRASGGGGTAYTSAYALQRGLDYVNLADHMKDWLV